MNGPGFIIGNIAKRDDFWNRKEEIQTIWKTLEKNNVLLKAPRRFGKTGNNRYQFTTKVLKDWWLRYYDLVEV